MPANKAIQWASIAALVAQFVSGSLTLPAFLAALSALTGQPVPAGAKKLGVMFGADNPIPANLLADLQSIVDAATQLQTDQAALAATNTAISAEQQAVTTDQTALANAQAQFTADLTAFLAPATP